SISGQRVTRETTQAETVVRGTELEATRGASLGEILQNVPGMSAIRTGAIHVPIIHGMFASRVAVFNDGVRHASQNWGLDHAPEVDPFGAERIRVIKGASGVLYGPEAIGGAILLEPRAYLDVPGIEGESYVRGESNGRGGAGALVLRGNHSALPQLAWRARVSSKISADLEAPANVIDNTDVREFNGGFSALWREDRWNLELSYDRFSNETGTFTGAASATATLEDFEAALDSDVPRDADLYEVEYDINRPRQTVTHSTLRGRAQFDLAQGHGLTLTVANQHDDRREFALVRRTIEGPQQVFELNTTSVNLLYEGDGMELAANVPLKLTFGAVGSNQQNTTTGTDRNTIPNYEALNAGVFGFGEFDLGDFGVELGARYDNRSIDAQTGNGFSNSETTEESYRFDALSLTVGIGWEIAAGAELHADLSSASRAPSAIEQFTNGRLPGLPGLVLGELEAVTETAWNASLGASYGWSWGRAEATAYVSQFDDFVYFAPLLEDGAPVTSLTIRGALPVFTYRQVDARIYGGEAVLNLEPFANLEWESSVSYVNGLNTTDDEFLVYIPPPRLQNTLTWRIPWDGMFFDSYISARSLVVFEQTNFEPSTDFAPPPSAYHLLSLAAGTSTELGTQRLNLGVAVNNATNARYRTYTSLQRYYTDEPGISVLFRAALQFSL
ncbi:MAG: TonB-dependent receptor, partial [Myxococcota bacterium]